MTLYAVAVRRALVAAVFAMILFATLFATTVVAIPLAATASTVESPKASAKQRFLFESVFEAVERGSWDAVTRLSAAEQALLEAYILWPDLRAAWLRRNLTSTRSGEIDAFMQRYGALKPARELRYRLALQHVAKNNLPAYLRLYEQYYQGQEIAKLDCLALQAHLQAGRLQRVQHRAIELWTVGKSQVSECDPVFAYLNNNDLLTAAHYKQRFELAIDNREFGLARWLAKSIDDDHVANATAWRDAQANPEDFLRQHIGDTGDKALRAQLAYAVNRLTFRDPILANRYWRQASARFAFSEAEQHLTTQHIALWMARDDLPGAFELLARLPKAAQNDEVLRWRARTSLKRGDWQNTLNAIDQMSVAERAVEEWQYWRAVALQNSGQMLAAKTLLQTLSNERSYYGFLAADLLDREYALAHQALLADEALIATLESRDDVIRARELYYVGLESRGRSEWALLTNTLSAAEKTQASILADRWGWHSRAIATAASIGEYDDLSLRYPLPYQEHFETASGQASIAPTWAYGIARSESLFMRDVRSHAGAVGLMQLMPATGKEVAQSIKLPYSGLSTLTNPHSNIRLGTTYLGQMAARYGGNHVLATAAYNAGPHRVDAWLPSDASLDALVWIENIPFNETRKYVRRVLAAQTIFHWRLTGETRRLSDTLPVVQPPALVSSNPLSSN